MGYESKLYIVEKSMRFNGENKCYAEVLAMFDMCKIYPVVPVFKKEADCYFYADDGDTEVLTDCYGDPIKEASLEDVISAIKQDIKNSGEYRRYDPLLAALEVYKEQQDAEVWGRPLAVLHYGY